MTKYILRFTWMLAVGLGLSFLTACEEESARSSEDVDEYTTQTVYDLQERSGCGPGGCYELVFPVTLSFPDGTVSEELNSYQDIRGAIRAWREDNPDAESRPTFSFPLDMVSEDGDLITIENNQQLFRARRACHRPFRPHHGQGQICFRLVFPLTVVFPDGTTEEADNPRQMQFAMRQWRLNNPDSDERPELQFPVSVTLENGDVIEVADSEELRALKDSCGD